MSVKLKVDLSGLDELIRRCDEAEVKVGEVIRKEMKQIVNDTNEKAAAIAKSHTRYARKNKPEDRTYNHIVPNRPRINKQKQQVTAAAGFKVVADGHSGLASIFLMYGAKAHLQHTPKGHTTFAHPGTYRQGRDQALYDTFYGRTTIEHRTELIEEALRRALAEAFK